MATTARPLCAPAREAVTDRCPGALQLHAAEDGALARVRIPGGRISAAQAVVLADAASVLGNGLIDLTSRANVQLRGLDSGAGEELATRLAAAGLLTTAEDLGRFGAAIATGALPAGMTEPVPATDGRYGLGLELEVVWLVPAHLVDAAAVEASTRISPLDLEREKARYGAETPGGIGISRVAASV